MSITTPQPPVITEDPALTAGGTVDDWDYEPLPVRPVRRRLGPITLLLAAFLVAGAAFTGGVIVEKGSVGTAGASTTSRQAPATAATAGRAAFGAAAGTAGAGGGATSGTVKLIDGSNIYITDSTGTTVKIATTPQSQISITAPGAVTAIKPGDTVTVTGSTGSDGTVTATNVRDAGAAGNANAAGGSRGGAATTGQGGSTNGATPAG
jgi:hypothetical protein